MERTQTTHNAASDSIKDATTLSSPAGNRSSEHNQHSTWQTKGCVIGHHAFIPWMALRMQNIELGPRPAHSYNTKSAIYPLMNSANSFYHWLKPLRPYFRLSSQRSILNTQQSMRSFTIGKLTMFTRHLEYEPPAHLSSMRIAITIRIWRTYAMGGVP